MHRIGCYVMSLIINQLERESSHFRSAHILTTYLCCEKRKGNRNEKQISHRIPIPIMFTIDRNNDKYPIQQSYSFYLHYEITIQPHSSSIYSILSYHSTTRPCFISFQSLQSTLHPSPIYRPFFTHSLTLPCQLSSHTI